MSESDLPAERARSRERLSALMDGEADRDLVQAVCRQWRQDEDDRAQWHAYHLIGDVLRSEDLGQRSTSDAAFLAGVRERLAREPVVLAPQPMIVPEQPLEQQQVTRTAQVVGLPVQRSLGMRMRRWVAPVGMAAGVALVAGAVLVTRPDALTSAAGQLAVSTPAPTAPTTVPAAPEVQTVRVQVPTGPEGDAADLIRYVNAHHQHLHDGASLGPAPGYLRSTSFETVPAR
ncbi:sigma-E factor negative regulatory protein [Sphaerotilus natans]|uniref:sigma-E factor negative regulatory protein n=1 Tax=Sphaerotilus natans TaxID=34103 RepID=UPI00406C0392